MLHCVRGDGRPSTTLPTHTRTSTLTHTLARLRVQLKILYRDFKNIRLQSHIYM